MFGKDKEKLQDWLRKIERDIRAVKTMLTGHKDISVVDRGQSDFSIDIGGERYDYYSTKADIQNRTGYYWEREGVKIKLYRDGAYCKDKSKPKLVEVVKGGGTIGHKTTWFCANNTVKCVFDNPWQLVAMVNVTLNIRSNGLKYVNFYEHHAALVKKSEEHFLSRPSDWDW